MLPHAVKPSARVNVYSGIRTRNCSVPKSEVLPLHHIDLTLYFPLFEHFFSHSERPTIFICGVSRQHYQNQGVALITSVRLPSESDHATAVRRALEATGFQRPSVECSLDGR